MIMIVLYWIQMVSLVAAIIVAIRLAFALYASVRVSKKTHVLVHVPTVWTLRSLYESANSVQRSSEAQPGFYVPARPQVNIGGLRWRLKCAWLAFTGQCDLVRWPEGQ